MSGTNVNVAKKVPQTVAGTCEDGKHSEDQPASTNQRMNVGLHDGRDLLSHIELSQVITDIIILNSKLSTGIEYKSWQRSPPLEVLVNWRY